MPVALVVRRDGAGVPPVRVPRRRRCRCTRPPCRSSICAGVQPSVAPPRASPTAAPVITADRRSSSQLTELLRCTVAATACAVASFGRCARPARNRSTLSSASRPAAALASSSASIFLRQVLLVRRRRDRVLPLRVAGRRTGTAPRSRSLPPARIVLQPFSSPSFAVTASWRRVVGRDQRVRLVDAPPGSPSA